MLYITLRMFFQLVGCVSCSAHLPGQSITFGIVKSEERHLAVDHVHTRLAHLGLPDYDMNITLILQLVETPRNIERTTRPNVPFVSNYIC